MLKKRKFIHVYIKIDIYIQQALAGDSSIYHYCILYSIPPKNRIRVPVVVANRLNTKTLRVFPPVWTERWRNVRGAL